MTNLTVRRLVVSVTVLLVAVSVGAGEALAAKRILYITHTSGFHHSACEYSVPVIKRMAEESKKDPHQISFDVVC